MVSSCIEENVSVCTALDASPVSPCCWCRLVDADAVGGTWPTPTCQVNYRVESVDPMSGRVQDESLLTHLMRHTGFWFSFFYTGIFLEWPQSSSRAENQNSKIVDKPNGQPSTTNQQKFVSR